MGLGRRATADKRNPSGGIPCAEFEAEPEPASAESLGLLQQPRPLALSMYAHHQRSGPPCWDDGFPSTISPGRALGFKQQTKG